jgi:hypothetical protein
MLSCTHVIEERDNNLSVLHVMRWLSRLVRSNYEGVGRYSFACEKLSLRVQTLNELKSVYPAS